MRTPRKHSCNCDCSGSVFATFATYEQKAKIKKCPGGGALLHSVRQPFTARSGKKEKPLNIEHPKQQRAE
jgi:hypothetical protein